MPGAMDGCRRNLELGETGRGAFQRGALAMVAKTLGALRILSGRFDMDARKATTEALLLSLVGNFEFDTLEDTVARGAWDGDLIHPVTLFLTVCEARFVGGELFERCRRIVSALDRAKAFEVNRPFGAPWYSAVRGICTEASASEIAIALEGTPFAVSFKEGSQADRLGARLAGILALSKKRRDFDGFAHPFAWAWCADVSLGSALLGFEDDAQSRLAAVMPLLVPEAGTRPGWLASSAAISMRSARASPQCLLLSFNLNADTWHEPAGSLYATRCPDALFRDRQ